ncbi:MAG: hypothetical protein IT292_03270 [Deltaproteobacteria bacterium]|nr:hypothetical protein [Deltaproteobacteria bacterium]
MLRSKQGLGEYFLASYRTSPQQEETLIIVNTTDRSKALTIQLTNDPAGSAGELADQTTTRKIGPIIVLANFSYRLNLN